MKKAKVFWFTGLSGSGKSTIANIAKEKLETKGFKVLILDGDQVREKYPTPLGFSEKDIKLNNKLIAEICLKNQKYYDLILVPIISPYEESRSLAKKMLSEESFYEIYISANLETVTKRDTKGLYRKTKEGLITNMIGLSKTNPYEVPKNPDLIIDSSNEQEDPKHSSTTLLNFFMDKINTLKINRSHPEEQAANFNSQ